MEFEVILKIVFLIVGLGEEVVVIFVDIFDNLEVNNFLLFEIYMKYYFVKKV